MTANHPPQNLLSAAVRLWPAPVVEGGAERPKSDDARGVKIWQPSVRTTVTVTSQSSLNSNVVSGRTIELGADIALTANYYDFYGMSGVYISGITGLVVDGVGLYEINGQGARRCFWIERGSDVALQNLVITNGFVSVGALDWHHSVPCATEGCHVSPAAPLCCSHSPSGTRLCWGVLHPPVCT